MFVILTNGILTRFKAVETVPLRITTLLMNTNYNLVNTEVSAE